MELYFGLLWITVALCGVGLLTYTKVIQPRRANLSRDTLVAHGFEHIFRDRFHEFIAFNNAGTIRLGNLLNSEFQEYDVDVVRDSRWEWNISGPVRIDKIILHLGDISRPIHVLQFRNNKHLAEHEWAKLDAVLSHSRYMFDQYNDDGYHDNQGNEEIKILFVAANPIDQSNIQLDEEVRSIAEKLRGTKYRDSVKFVSEWAARPSDMLRSLNGHNPQSCTSVGMDLHPKRYFLKVMMAELSMLVRPQ